MQYANLSYVYNIAYSYDKMSIIKSTTCHKTDTFVCISSLKNEQIRLHRINKHRKELKVRCRSCDTLGCSGPSEQPATTLHSTKGCTPAITRRLSTLQYVLLIRNPITLSGKYNVRGLKLSATVATKIGLLGDDTL